MNPKRTIYRAPSVVLMPMFPVNVSFIKRVIRSSEANIFFSAIDGLSDDQWLLF